MQKSPDIREFLGLALRAGTQFYVFILAIVVIEQFVAGRFWLSWPEAVAAYPVSVVLFIAGPAVMWMFFRLLILISSRMLHRKQST